MWKYQLTVPRSLWGLLGSADACPGWPVKPSNILKIVVFNLITWYKYRKYTNSDTNKDTFLTKIQNRISEKTRKKIVLLSCKKIVKTQFLGVVEFPSIFWIQFFKVVGFPSNFWIQFFKVVEFPSDFWIFVRNVTTSKN